tara:strand:+ start:396 stop:806 length:411 start_codon:yes stop_codon:yes gene_type:complete
MRVKKQLYGKEYEEAQINALIKKTAKKQRAKSVRELEREVGLTHIGSFEIDNELKVKSDIYLDEAKWVIKAAIEYKLNGRKRTLKVRADAHDMVSSDRVTEMVRGHVLEDLSRLITLEAMEQNKMAISAATREFRG